jgi:hypothetical protein
MNFKAFSRNAVLPSASTSANSAGLPITDLSSAEMEIIVSYLYSNSMIRFHPSPPEQNGNKINEKKCTKYCTESQAHDVYNNI